MLIGPGSMLLFAERVALGSILAAGLLPILAGGVSLAPISGRGVALVSRSISVGGSSPTLAGGAAVAPTSGNGVALGPILGRGIAHARISGSNASEVLILFGKRVALVPLSGRRVAPAVVVTEGALPRLHRGVAWLAPISGAESGAILESVITVLVAQYAECALWCFI